MCLAGCETPSSPSSGSNPSGSSGSTTQPCPCATKDFAAVEVDESISETISNAPARYARWNGTYGWQSKFTLEVKRSNCCAEVTVKVKVTGPATAAHKAAWKSAIESKWNNKAKLACPDSACTTACPNGYRIAIKLEYVESGEHYPVRANNPGATEGGRAGLGGTTSMTGWGVDDTVDVTHEFGHMLGAPEEYFTTNGVDYTEGGTKNGFRDPGAGIMNNPSGNPLPRNFDHIRRQVASATGLTCTTRPA